VSAKDQLIEKVKRTNVLTDTSLVERTTTPTSRSPGRTGRPRTPSRRTPSRRTPSRRTPFETDDPGGVAPGKTRAEQRGSQPRRPGLAVGSCESRRDVDRKDDVLADQRLFLTQLVTLLAVLDPVSHLTLFLTSTAP
jgi:hypothetical protein